MSAVVAFIRWLLGALGAMDKVAPKTTQTVLTDLGLPASVDPAEVIAGAEALLGINWKGIQDEFNAGQIVTAGAMAVDDVLKIIAKYVPAAVVPEEVAAILVAFGQHSLAHNSGEGGIGNDPAGNGNVTALKREN